MKWTNEAFISFSLAMFLKLQYIKILIALDKDWDYEKIMRYAEQFKWENIAEQLIEIYKSAARGLG